MSKLLISDNRPIKQTMTYGNERIPYRVFFLQQKTSKIIIDVLPNGVVHVKSPEGRSLKSIKQAVQIRARWIHNHLEKIRSHYAFALPRHYVSGECHYYLGRRFVLKVFLVKNIEPSVKLRRGQIQVRTRSRKPETIKSLLDIWYRQHARKVFERRLKALALNIRWLKSVPAWKMRTMKRQWGSCSPKGVLTLNPQLVKAPRECIDYVIIHELCHIKEHNHSPKYYKLLRSLAPDWEATKARLDGMSELLLAV